MTDSARSFVSPARTIFRTVVVAAAVWLAGYGTALAQPLTHSQGPGLGTIPLGTVEIQLAASGGNGPGTYTWSLVSGALPPNVRLRTDVPSFFSSSANAGLIGVATTPGDYTFMLRVASGAATPVDRQYTLKIIGLVQADNGIPDAFLNRPYSYQLLYANNTGAVTYASTNTPPTGLTVSSSGLISGTPTVSGFFSINFSITDSTGTLFRSIGLNISRVRVDSPGSLPNATQGANYDYVVTASGGSGSFTFSDCPGNTGTQSCAGDLQSFPSGLSMDSTGHVTGTVTAGPGRYSITVTATDTNNVSYSKLMSLDVEGNPPTLPGLFPYGNIADDMTIGVGWSRGVSALNGGKAPFTWTASGLPPGMFIRYGSGNTSSYVTPNDAEIFGSPTVLGPYQALITAIDADGVTVSNTFPMRVVELQQRDFLTNGTLGVPYTRTFRVIGGRPPYSVVQLPGGVLPAGLALEAANFRVAGTPQENSQINFSFDPIFQFTDADNQTVSGRNYFSIAGTSTLVVNTGNNLGTRTLNAFNTTTFTACCAPSFVWSLQSGTLPPGMTLSADGTLSGTATVEGTFVFVLKAADAANPSNFALRQFTVIVTPLSITGNVPGISNVGVSLALPLTPVTNGAAPYTFSLFPLNYLPPGLTLDADGSLHGTLTSPGQYSFTVQVTDGVGRYARRGYNMSIYPAGVNPPLNLNIGPTIGPRGVGILTQSLNTSGGRAPYHYQYTPGAPQVPGMRVQDGQPLPTNFSATGGFVGVIDQPNTYPTSIRVTDADGQVFDRAITVIVTSINQLSQATLPKGTIGTPYSFQLIPYGGSGNYSFSLTGSFPPPGLSLSSTGLISGTPTAPWTQSFNVQLTDLSTQETLGVFYTIVVDPFTIGVNGAPSSGVLPLATQNVFYNQTVTAPGCGSNCIFTSNLNTNGLTLASNGVIQGTPTGTFSNGFTVTATGSNGTASRVFSLQIQGNTLNPLAITTTAVGPSTVGNTTATGLFAFGGRPPYSWALVSGTLPTGITLQSPGETVGNLNPGFFYLAGRAMVAGTYTFTVSVTDANGVSVQRTFDWNVSRLAFQNTSLPLFFANGTSNPLVLDTPYTQPLLAIGGNGVYTFANTNAMPPGLQVPASGVVFGAPSNTGSVTTAVRVQDTAGNSIITNHTFNVSGPTSTILGFNSGPNFGNFQQGFSTSFNVTPTGGTAPYTITALSAMPPGFALESGNSLLSGDAAGTFRVGGMPLAPGSFAFTLKATDANNNVGVRTFTFNVSTTTRFSNATLADGSVGRAYSQQLVAFDNAGSITWSVSPTSGLPPGMTLTSGGLVGGTPTTQGNYSFTLVSTDSAGTTINFTFSVRISRLGITDPGILPDTRILPIVPIVGQFFSYPFIASPSVAGAVWSATGLPNGVSMAANGTLSGTPTSAGMSTLLVTVTDGQVAFSRRFTLSVRLPNASQLDSSLTASAFTDVTVGQSVTLGLNNSGGRPPYQWALAPGSTLPPGLSLLRFDQNLPDRTPGNSAVVGMPTTVGQYAFDLLVTDANNQTVRRTFTLNVSALAFASGVQTTPRNATFGVAYSQRFLAVGGTPPYTFTYSAISGNQEPFPPGLTLSTDGVLSGTPTSTGSYSFRLKATDTAGNNFSRTNTLIVASPSGLVAGSNNPSDISVGRSLEFDLSVFQVSGSASNYTWSLVSGSMPEGTHIDGDSLGGVATMPGTFVFTLRATDNANALITADHVYTLNVAPMQIVSPPEAISQFNDLPSGHVGQFYSFTLKAAGGVPPYSFVESPFIPLPPGVTLGLDGVLSGTPQVAGSFSVAPIVTDGSGKTLRSSLVPFVVTPAGVPAPLIDGSDDGGLFPGSVGAPYIFPLGDAQLVLRGGTPPFNWATAPGSQLPPGVSLLPGGNGITNIVAGIPTTAGEYPLTLIVTDGTGQQLAVPIEHFISPLAVTPSAIDPMVVGTPVSITIAVNGGVPPYTVDSVADMPPGLTLTSGLLSGTPTYAGNFAIVLFVSDANGAEFYIVYRATVDNALGEVPGLSIGPKPIQIFYQTGAPIPAPVPLNVSTSSGQVPFTAITAGIPGASLSSGSGTTSSGITLNANLGSLSIGTYNGIVAVKAAASSNTIDVTPVTVVVSAPPPCGYTLNPPNASIPAAGGTGSFGVSTNPACTWSATVPPASAITITSPTSGAGVGTVSYRLSANPGTTPRTLRVTVQGQQHTITQFGSNCNFVLGVSTLSAPAAGGTASISVTPSNASCPSWSASSATLGLSPLSATGTGTLVVTVPPNGAAAPRTLTALVGAAGIDQKTLTVNQAGAACTVGLSPYSTLVPSAGANGQQIGITLPSGCSYDTTAAPSWVSITSGASGNASGTLFYTVQPNSTTVQRIGTLMIGGQAFQITQDPTSCSVTTDTSLLGSPYAAGGGTGLVGVGANGSNCSWTASSDAQWAVLSTSGGSGNGSVGITLQSNAASVTSRSANLTIAGQTIAIVQSGTACTFTLQSPAGTVPAQGGGGSVGVIAPAACAWSATSGDPSWLTVASAGPNGVGEVQFLAQPNSGGQRQAALTVAGQPYTVTQAAAPCVYNIDGSSLNIAAGGAHGSFTFSSANASCTPSALSYAGWISNTTTAAGVVSFDVGSNPTTTTRVGTIRLGEQNFSIVQTGGLCGFSLNSYSALFQHAGAIDQSFSGSPSALGCTVNPGTDQPGFIHLGNLLGPVSNIFTLPYAIDGFDSLTPSIRFGKITFGGQIFQVKQTSY